MCNGSIDAKQPAQQQKPLRDMQIMRAVLLGATCLLTKPTPSAIIRQRDGPNHYTVQDKLKCAEIKLLMAKCVRCALMFFFCVVVR